MCSRSVTRSKRRPRAVGLPKRERIGLLLALLFPALAPSARASEATPAAAALRVGLTPTFPHDQYRPLEQWRRYMEARLGRPVEFVRRDRYVETMDLLRLKKLDFAWVCDYPYMYFKTQVKLLAVPLYQGRPYYQSLLIVPASDTSTRSLLQLKGKVFAYSDPYSNTGYLTPQYELMQAGADPSKHFRKTFFAWSHRRVLEAVANGLADGGAMSSHVWDTMSIGRPELTRATRIVAKSPDNGFAPFVAQREIDDATFAAMQALLLGMAADAQGRALLKELNLDGFVVGSDQLFERVERMMRAMGEKR